MGCVIRIHHVSQLVNRLCSLPNDVFVVPMLFRTQQHGLEYFTTAKPEYVARLVSTLRSRISASTAPGSPNRSSNQRRDVASYHQEAGMKFQRVIHPSGLPYIFSSYRWRRHQDHMTFRYMNLQINEWRMASIEYRYCDARRKPKESCEADGDAGSCHNECPQRKSSLHGSDLLAMIGKHRCGLGCNSLIFPRLTTLLANGAVRILRQTLDNARPDLASDCKRGTSPKSACSASARSSGDMPNVLSLSSCKDLRSDAFEHIWTFSPVSSWKSKLNSKSRAARGNRK